MKKTFFFLLFSVVLAITGKGQAIDTVKTINDGKPQKIYTANKLYYEKNYDTLRHLVYEGLKFNTCFLGIIQYYQPNGTLKETRQYYIEPPGDEDLKRWTWMKNYRVWEANRKAFVYPENWIQPDLEHDNSSYFRELEKELRCNIPHGKWIKYDKKGKPESAILYEKGKKVKSY